LTVFAGLPEEEFEIFFKQYVQGGSASATSQVISQWRVGIGWNATNAYSGMIGEAGQRIDGASIDMLLHGTSEASYTASAAIGINVATSLEQMIALNNASMTWYGTSAGMQLVARYMG
jgi:hypothetical protein